MNYYNIILSHPGVRAPQHHCSTPWTMTTTTRMTTSAPTGRRTSAHHWGTSAPQVRTTSCPPSLCKQMGREVDDKAALYTSLLDQTAGELCHMLFEKTTPKYLCGSFWVQSRCP